MWIPLQSISHKFALLLKDLRNCNSDKERKKVLDNLNDNWKYCWISEEIKSFFKKQNWKK